MIKLLREWSVCKAMTWLSVILWWISLHLYNEKNWKWDFTLAPLLWSQEFVYWPWKLGWLWQWWCSHKLHTIAWTTFFWQGSFHCLHQVSIVREKIFILRCGCSSDLGNLNLQWKLHLPADYSMQNYKTKYFVPQVQSWCPFWWH